MSQEPRPRWRRPSVLWPAAAVVTACATYVTSALALGGSAPRGTTVLGADVGGLQREQVAAAIAAPAAAASRQAVPVVVHDGGGAVAEVALAPAGLTVDVEATVDRLTGPAWSPTALWRHLTGAGEVRPETDIDRDVLAEAVQEQVAAAVEVAPVEGSISFAAAAAQGGDVGTDVEVVVTDPAPGRAVDVPAAARIIAAAWPRLGGSARGPVEVSAEQLETEVSAEAVRAAVEEIARPAVQGDLRLSAPDRSVVLAPTAFAAALQVRPVQGEMALVADGDVLRAAVLSAEESFEVAAQDARIQIDDEVPQVVPAVDGLQVDPLALATAAQQALAEDGTRIAQVDLVVSSPQVSTEELAGLGIVEQISTFTTTLTDNPARTQNIRLAAAAVDGTLLRPGQEFSLNDTVGERTAERGYQQAGVISDGRLVDGYGGGVSQVSTTLFNAMFFAGLDELEHRPHSIYFTRYPEGREATLDWRSIDNRFRNDAPTGVYIQADIEGSRVVVSMYGTRRYDVEAVKGPRTDVTDPATIEDDSQDCSPQSSAPGFTTTVTRVLRPVDGGPEARETFTTRYNPQNAVVCTG